MVKTSDKGQNDHYIPRVFLKAFQDTREQNRGVWRFVRGQRAPELVPLKRVASSQNFYQDEAFDRRLKEIESKIGPVLKMLRRHPRCIPERNSTAFLLMVQFLCDLMVRNPRMRSVLDEASNTNVRHIIQDLRGSGIDVEERLRAEESDPLDPMVELIQRAIGERDTVSESTRAAVHAMAARERRVKLDQTLAQRNWRLYFSAPGGPHFITCDDPVVSHDASGIIHTGIGQMASWVTVVLAPTVALEGRFAKVKPEYLQLDERGVRRINGIMAKAAHREIYANRPSFQWQRRVGRQLTESDWF